MIRRLTIRRALIVPWIAAFGIVCISHLAVLAQDAQSAAQAKIAREKAAAERLANTTLPAADTGREKGDVQPPKSGDLNKRAGEQVAGNPRGKSVVFGMHVQEGDSGRVKVVAVGAATPAYDAGIREGDELLSFKDFKANSYRKWIDGMSKVASSAPDGSMLPIVVLRQGKQVATEIRVHEGRNAPLQLPIGPPPAATQEPPVGIGINVNEGVSDVLVNNDGAFGAFFQEEASRGTERAMAQLMRVGNKQPVSDPAPQQDVSAKGEVGANWTAKPVPPKPDSRIGLAGFRNDSNGMLVMVDVGALEPGNYLVGIGDPSVVGQQPVAPIAPNPAAPQQKAPSGATTENTSGTTGTGIPASGLAHPLSTPASGQVNPSGATPAGQSSANVAISEQINQANGGNAGNSGTPMIREIGLLTVDQSGTGRMQQTVEAIQVGDVVGQAIVLYSQPTGNPKTLPPNLDPTVDPAAPDLAAGQPGKSSNGAPVANLPANRGTELSGAGQPSTGAVAAPTNGGPAPVAAGIIRLVSDRQSPPVESDAAVAQEFGEPQAPQPANKAPAVPPKTVR